MRTVLIVEDHPICVAALVMAIQAIDEAISVDSVDTLKEAREHIRTIKYEAVLLDLGLKDSQGLTNLTALKALTKATPILIVSSNDSEDIEARARVLGARGFLRKTAPVSQMKLAVAAILDGSEYFPELQAPDQDLPTTELPPAPQISPAQSRVMAELAKGNSNKIIAHELNLSEATVKSHLSAIFKALRVTNRTQAILALRGEQGAR